MGGDGINALPHLTFLFDDVFVRFGVMCGLGLAMDEKHEHSILHMHISSPPFYRLACLDIYPLPFPSVLFQFLFFLIHFVRRR